MKEINELFVHYGDNEYTSHIRDDEMARLYALQPEYRAQWPLLVQTSEHGGWGMVYYFDEQHQNGICVGTANDMAKFQPEQERIRERLYNARRKSIGDIRRPPRATVAA